MAEPFLAEVRLFSFNFAPRGWAMCNGQLLPINQNQGLFSLLGTTYGGDGRVNFALPNLQGRTPIHIGQGHTLGEVGGEQAHTLTIAELAGHSHVARANSNAANVGPITNTTTWSAESAAAYSATPNAALGSAALGSVGGSQPHLNMQPFLVINFCIALQGIFPSQT